MTSPAVAGRRARLIDAAAVGLRYSIDGAAAVVATDATSGAVIFRSAIATDGMDSCLTPVSNISLRDVEDAPDVVCLHGGIGALGLDGLAVVFSGTPTTGVVGNVIVDTVLEVHDDDVPANMTVLNDEPLHQDLDSLEDFYRSMREDIDRAIALLPRKHQITGQLPLLAVIGAVFFAVIMSVVLQVLSFRLRGRRIFRMAPLHHHFELAGWDEEKITLRFWIVAALAGLLGFSVFLASLDAF